jgi:OFA family oxalate/formate antiporter-like MFS transporter
MSTTPSTPDYGKFRLERISYGGFLGVFPAITADFWGSKNMGVSYGIILLGFGIGAIASSPNAGYYKNLANIKEVVGGVTKVMRTDLRKMQPAFVIASVASIASVAGLVLMAALKPPVPKKK